jgi:hypothetical protein
MLKADLLTQQRPQQQHRRSQAKELRDCRSVPTSSTPASPPAFASFPRFYYEQQLQQLVDSFDGVFSSSGGSARSVSSPAALPSACTARPPPLLDSSSITGGLYNDKRQRLLQMAGWTVDPSQLSLELTDGQEGRD